MVLRAPKLEDTEAIFYLRTDEVINQHINRKKWTSIEQASSWLQEKPQLFLEDLEITWVVEDLETKRVIGAIGFEINKAKRSAEIGDRLDKKYWGSKRAAQATNVLIEFIFKRKDIDNIEAKVLEGNIRAISLLQKFGFSYQGEVKGESNSELNYNVKKYILQRIKHFKTMEHNYNATIKWTGNTNGNGTASYKSYERSYEVIIADKKVIQGSSDPAFRGDNTKHNPEELFLASISSCHMLCFLHLCAQEGITVMSYIDRAEGKMIENKDDSGQFKEVVLKPKVIIKEEEKKSLINSIHEQANKMCFIANSCNFEIRHEPQTRIFEEQSN